MQATFRSVREFDPGVAWQTLFTSSWDSYRAWFLQEGDARRPGYLTCKAALERHLPELVRTWETLVDLAGGGDMAARFLSLYCPAPYLSGCSQAVWTKGDRPLLIRNYDYHPRLLEGTILMSAWSGVRTIVQSDCLWGALDGMNEHGVAVSLSFGGRSKVGDGFGIPLLLRYILETCRDCDEARRALARVPTHMSYNVSGVDRDGDWFTAHVAPDRPVRFHESPVATNHQDSVEWHRYAQAVSTLERWHLLTAGIADDSVDEHGFVSRFLEPPVFSDRYGSSFGTLYTAIYNPREGVVDYVWKNRRWQQSFSDFEEGWMTVPYGKPVAS
ncbi:MAG: C45 family peptidase [Bryobacteraceae bacterium]